MSLHYLTFMGRNLENKKKLTSEWMKNSANMNSKIIVISVGIITGSTDMNSISSEWCPE
jgi:hypothetical protein